MIKEGSIVCGKSKENDWAFKYIGQVLGVEDNRVLVNGVVGEIEIDNNIICDFYPMIECLSAPISTARLVGTEEFEIYLDNIRREPMSHAQFCKIYTDYKAQEQPPVDSENNI